MERQDEIHSKGFDMGTSEYSKLKVGLKTLSDATLNLGSLKSSNKTMFNKEAVIRALASRDLSALRAISNYFYDTNGVY